MRGFALVTGAGSGIGQAVALALAADGWQLALLGRREAALRDTASRLDQEALILPTDVCDEAQVAQAFALAEARFGRLDLLFNNAGVSSRKVPVDELSVSEWRHVVETNLTGSFICAREAFKLMKRQHPRGGRIINNGSISAHVPRPFSAPYTATKHGVTGLTRSLLLDGRAHDIAVGQIDIGNAATSMAAPMQQGILQANGQTAVEPTVDVAEVARAVVYMASLPLAANVPFMTVMATAMPFIGRG